jgi:trk system potassium uptake protein
MNVIIIGAGRVGARVGKILSQEGHNVTIVDNDQEACRRAMDQLDAMVLQGSGSQPDVLLEAGIKQCEMLVAVTASDEVNILSCLIASKLGVPKKIARLTSNEFSKPDGLIKKEDLGIDLIIYPEEETARELVWLIRRTTATDVIEYADGKVQLIGLRLDKDAPIMNKTLVEISTENPGIDFRVVAVVRTNETIIPTGRDIVTKGDQLFCIVKTDSLPELLKITGKSESKLENLMILGGGKVGRMVAAELEHDKHLNLKLIESNREKSVKIANTLIRTLLIVGDGTDLDLLVTEGIMDMDGYIAVTEDEESNIISCLMAKHMGVRRTLALVNRPDYLPIMSSIGLDAAVDKQMITANAILQFIRRGKIVSLSTLRGVEAEVLEFEVTPQSKIVGKNLNKIKIPNGAIIGMITRGEDVIVPTGDCVIEAGDKMIVFSLPSAVPHFEKFII